MKKYIVKKYYGDDNQWEDYRIYNDEKKARDYENNLKENGFKTDFVYMGLSHNKEYFEEEIPF